VFGAPTIQVGGTTTVTFTITNSNPCPPSDVAGQCLTPAPALMSLAFTDVLPPGLVVALSPGVINGCLGPVTAAPGTGTISLSGGNLPGSSALGGFTQCFITVNVSGTTPGLKVNSVVLASDQGPAGPATATLLVIGP